jgi:TonB C terminal
MRPTQTIRRRRHRPTPMSRLRLGAAARSGGAAVLPFPGIELPKPEGRGRRAGAGFLAGAIHLGLLGALFAYVWMTPPVEEEKPIPIELVEIKPPPPPPPPPKPAEPPKIVEKPPAPVPIPKPPVPAPAPKALAERRSVNFEPSAQAIAPQVVNPSVIQKASPSVDAKALDVKALQSAAAAPTEIKATGIAVQTVQAVTNVAAASAPRAVDVGSVSAPAVRGPVNGATQVGAMVGPKAIAAPGNSVGAGTVVRSGDGSSVREGAVTGRDVLGSPDGERLANVNTRVGQGNMRGDGTGSTLGGNEADCDSRPEVAAYQAQVRERTKARWIAPPGMQGSAKATLSWKLDVSGSATSVRLVNASNNLVGNSVVEALRAAAPFPAMSDRVRCLANRTLTGTFTLTPEG